MIPLYKPYMPENLPELNEILHSGALSYGKWGKAFENKLQEFIGTSNIAIVNSYNSAMLVTLTTLGVKCGDEVIASPMSCLASNQPFATMGITVVWADIDPETGTLSPEDVQKKITKKTKAIFHNHFCGYLGYIDEINEIGKKHGLFVVDDAIEAFGSEYKGNKIGNLGTDATIFSFQTVRLPNTIDGGAVVFKNSDLFEKAKRSRDYGIDRTRFRDEIGEISSKFDISEPGFGALPNEINSYIGCRQMDLIEHIFNIQQLNAKQWITILADKYPDITFIKQENSTPNFWVFGLRVSDKIKYLKFFRDNNFYASGVHLNNNAYSVFGSDTNLLGVNEFFKSFLAIPCGWWVDKNQITF
jgi:dTDP-4-amino-4,6-dideoxygalactose transaminase